MNKMLRTCAVIRVMSFGASRDQCNNNAFVSYKFLVSEIKMNDLKNLSQC